MAPGVPALIPGAVQATDVLPGLYVLHDKRDFVIKITVS